MDELAYDTAPVPDIADLAAEVPATQATESVQIQQADQHHLLSLALHPGWRVFTERIEKRIYQLKTLDGVTLAGLKPEEVGQKYLVAREAAGVLEDELKYVRTVAKSLSRVRNKLIED